MNQFNGDDLVALGLKGRAVGLALRLIPEASKSLDREAIVRELQAVLADPIANLTHPHFSQLAELLKEQMDKPAFVERAAPAPFQVWGEGIEEHATQQIRNAVRLPVAVAGALMPDAHLGYGLPIGGVLATDNAVIPYAVGVDIACRMRLSVFDVSAKDMKRLNEQLVRALQRETKFGTGVEFQKPLQHDVLDEDWNITAVTRKNFEKARGQLGTSGSGNHFVEFGIFTLDKADLGLEPGEYLSLLSHSGSRGTGAAVADFYSRLAMAAHPELPDELRRLAWLDMATEAGQEYWAAMNLMGKYAAANHEMIHKNVARALGLKPIAGIENHHNFAWKETHGGKDVIVHRKGATPAGKGVLGVIPGSMATPGFVVRGKGLPASLQSASHGAGRLMSRTAAREKFRWAHVKPLLEAAGVQLLSAGIDEAPVVYKNIHDVMKAQDDLVEIVARFDPKIVRMADAGEKPED
ncbi:MAG TPA: RtcB family protein [Tepidisphaeraceae bacterium]|jgi:tRNA-splicing ligase RtcB|nr:RtcB family protein [Tepidisphaeraceae bacterium]